MPLKRLDAMHYRWMSELLQGGSKLVYRPGTGVMHKGVDGLSRNVPGIQELQLSKQRDWIEYRLQEKSGVPGAIEEDQGDPQDQMPELPEIETRDYDEDRFDNWKNQADPSSLTGHWWTGYTECERASDGTWQREVHEEPRERLFVPEGEDWTGRRRSVCKYVPAPAGRSGLPSAPKDRAGSPAPHRSASPREEAGPAIAETGKQYKTGQRQGLPLHSGSGEPRAPSEPTPERKGSRRGNRDGSLARDWAIQEGLQVMEGVLLVALAEPRKLSLIHI